MASRPPLRRRIRRSPEPIALEDVERLRHRNPELAPFSDEVIQDLYSNWSEQEWCAGWMHLTDDIERAFRSWLVRRYR